MKPDSIFHEILFGTGRDYTEDAARDETYKKDMEEIIKTEDELYSGLNFHQKKLLAQYQHLQSCVESIEMTYAFRAGFTKFFMKFSFLFLCRCTAVTALASNIDKGEI